ncbi:hypothetical protein HGRIS_005143 [Hohenbuehelia grisea]|uniref:F-box domain-containing protein n=1 Tax=Hohenbuehelia grisea TaxID=104357 RepID=A0ABR3JET1_9AGAR
MMSSLPFPEDIFFHVLSYLDIADIIALRLTCKGIQDITKSKSIWLTLLSALVVEPNLPIPRLGGRSIEELDAAELELHAKLALRLRRKWIEAEPVARQQVLLQAPVPPHQSRVISVRFLPGRSNRWLLSVHREDLAQRTQYRFRCWDVSAAQPTVVACKSFPELSGLAVNADPQNAGIVAVGCPHVEIFGIDFLTSDPAAAFVQLKVCPDHTERLCGFSGNTIIARARDVVSFRVWDYTRPEVEVILMNPENQQNEECHGVVIRQNFIMVLRSTTLETYALAASQNANHAQAGQIVLHPITSHRWQWRVDSGCIVEQVIPSKTEPGTPPPIYLLVRFGSWFPWPVNLMHHFAVDPNDAYSPAVSVGPNNLPYNLLPRTIQTIASPVRLFSATHMVLGPYGTALWLDSHTEDYFGQSDRGQRLASRLLSLVPDEEDDGSPASATASTIYDVHEEDSWVRVALQEEEGRIVVGRSDGVITVYDYT